MKCGKAKRTGCHTGPGSVGSVRSAPESRIGGRWRGTLQNGSLNLNQWKVLPWPLRVNSVAYPPVAK